MAARIDAKPKPKVIIDTDAGIDDAQAIMMALSDDRVEVCAITTVCGNTSVDNVVTNVLRTLQLCGRLNVSFRARLTCFDAMKCVIYFRYLSFVAAV